MTYSIVYTPVYLNRRSIHSGLGHSTAKYMLKDIYNNCLRSYEEGADSEEPELSRRNTRLVCYDGGDCVIYEIVKDD